MGQNKGDPDVFLGVNKSEYEVSICKAYEVWVPYSALLCILVPEHDEHLLIIVVFLAQWWNF